MKLTQHLFELITFQPQLASLICVTQAVVKAKFNLILIIQKTLQLKSHEKRFFERVYKALYGRGKGGHISRLPKAAGWKNPIVYHYRLV